jgi:hypothetical protein
MQHPWKRLEMQTKFQDENMKGSDNLANLAGDGRALLKQILGNRMRGTDRTQLSADRSLNLVKTIMHLRNPLMTENVLTS